MNSMPQTVADSPGNADEGSGSRSRKVPRRVSRVDGPHPVSHETSAELPNQPAEVAEVAEVTSVKVEESTPEILAAAAALTGDARQDQLQLQASQLASYLKERLRDVDRREAQLNARAAEIESSLRASKLWLRERDHEFEQLEKDLRRQIADLESRVAGKPEDSREEPADWETIQQQIQEREHQLQLKENEVRERRFEAERNAAALRHSQQIWEQERARQESELSREREQMSRDLQELNAARAVELQSAEACMAQQAEHLQRELAALTAERRHWEEQRDKERRALDERAEMAEIEIANGRERLKAREEWIERQKEGVERLRGEIITLHRQSLEMRLFAEQIWAQISGRLTPAEITQSIAHLRLKLAEQYGLEEQGLQSRRTELIELGEKIAAQHNDLKQLREGMRSWMASRQEEIEQQAARLVQRELELDAQQDGFRRSEQQWHTERREFQQQIHRLTSQLRDLAVPA